jgi:hypothetical protein
MPRILLTHSRQTCNRSKLAGSSREYRSTILTLPKILSHRSIPASGANRIAHDHLLRMRNTISTFSRRAPRARTGCLPVIMPIVVAVIVDRPAIIGVGTRRVVHARTIVRSVLERLGGGVPRRVTMAEGCTFMIRSTCPRPTVWVRRSDRSGPGVHLREGT